MNKIEQAKKITIRSLVATIFFAIGIMVAAQIRSVPARVTNPIAPYVSLKETKESLYDEQNSLKSEIKDLQSQIQTVQDQTDSSILSKDELSELTYKKAQAGLTKLNGRGVIVQLDDSQKSLIATDAIIHASDLRDVINLLWDSGAEGISLNDQRLVVSTAVDCIVNTVLVNNVRLSTPFRIEAIGDQTKMLNAITSHSYLGNLYQRRDQYGIVFDTRSNNDITLPAFDGTFNADLGAN